MDQKQQQQQQQQQPKLTNSKNHQHRTLPILDYYLTFIHFFGFSINPDDDHRSRYLSIRIKTQARPAGGATTTNRGAVGDNNQQHPIRYHQEREWLASYTRRARRRLHSLPFPLFSYMKTTVKYMAITFNTFIATNHCIVLVDYICTGSRGIEDIILEIRLVMTKLSALIFVLSWHYKRHEVRQLIKLVKSTSLYILATHGSKLPLSNPNNQQAASASIAAVSSKSAALGSPLLAPESPFPSPIISADVSSTATTTSAAGGEQLISDEIGSSLRLDTREFDKRILRGWFGCLMIIIVHFSLSEAEISKSYHLWQWLDDYSLHQLGNQSVSYETLMFLATFDNYIYTVHVYGTRLIGASIICIVCSLQHEVIKSLNLYTLRLVKRSQHELLRGPLAPSSAATLSSLETASSSSSSSVVGTGSQTSLIPDGNDSSGNSSKPALHLDSNKFFVLGESDWFRVQELREQLEPHGHLTEFVWRSWLQYRQHQSALVELGSQLTKRMCRLIGRNSPTCGWSPFMRRAAVDLSRVTPKSEQQQQPQRATFDQVASLSMVATTNQRRRQGARTRPTPLKLSRPSEANGLTRFTHANSVSVGAGGSGSGSTRLHNAFTKVAPSTGKHLRWPTAEIGGLSSASTALCWSNPLRSSDEYQARLMSMVNRVGVAGRFLLNPSSAAEATQVLASSKPAHSQQQQEQRQATGARRIELQMERLSTKYELVRTVNARIDAFFGPMLLVQFSFLFLMSCIDLVFFSLCFSPNTKTKYIIISGMILLWCPYMLIYKFASDMGSSSRELLVSIRRLARLYLLEDQADLASRVAAVAAAEQHLWSAFRLESTNRFLYNNRLLASSVSGGAAKTPLASTGRVTASATATANFNSISSNSSSGTNIGAGILDKLDHIFKPTHLSIMGIMTVDKFFLLNFAKIVITSSVMMIQFISN